MALICTVPSSPLPPPRLIQLNLLSHGTDSLRGQLEGLHHLVIVIVFSVTVELELDWKRAFVAARFCWVNVDHLLKKCRNGHYYYYFFGLLRGDECNALDVLWTISQGIHVAKGIFSDKKWQQYISTGAQCAISSQGREKNAKDTHQQVKRW